MSIFTITVDEFMRLTLPQHQQALALYDREIGLLEELLAWPPAVIDSPVSVAHHVTKWTEERENFQKLRDVHQNRIEELQAEAAERDGTSLLSALAA